MRVGLTHDAHAAVCARQDAAPKHLTVYNNKLYFSADDGTHGHELWVYDGTNTPTMVADININEDSYNYGSPDIVEQTQGSEVVRPPTPIDRIPSRSRARACECVWV